MRKSKRIIVAVLVLAMLACVLPMLSAFADKTYTAQRDVYFAKQIVSVPVRDVRIAEGSLPPGLGLSIKNDLLYVGGVPDSSGLYTARIEYVVISSGETKSEKLTIDVWAMDKYGSSAKIKSQPNIKTYFIGESFDPTGMVVTGTMTYIDGRTESFSVLNECVIDYCTYGEKFDKAGQIDVNVYWETVDKYGYVDNIKAGKVTVTVMAPGEPPEFVTPKKLPDGVVGEKYSKTIMASGSDVIGEYYNPGKSNQLGDTGLSISANGKLSGTPKKAGTFKFTLYASNAFGEDYREFTITIKKAEPSHTHTLGEWETELEPTCVDPGEEVRKCTGSGCSYSERREIPATGIHDMTEWTLGHSPNSEQADNPTEWEHRTCKNCDYAEEREIEALPTEALPPEEHTHVTDGEWLSDEIEHWQECECGERLNVSMHTVTEWEAVQGSAKGQPAKEKGKCIVCGYEVERYTEYGDSNTRLLFTPLMLALIGGGVLLIATGVVLAIVFTRKPKRTK